MNKYTVTITLNVAADDANRAAGMGYDLVYYGRDNAECKSGSGYIDNYDVDVSSKRAIYE